MRGHRVVTVVVAALALAAAAAGAPRAAEVPEALVQEARGLARTFFTRLKGELQKAIAEKGPAGAIGVCGEAAPGIGTRVSQESGWAVGRTALRVRNPRNAPSPRERAVLIRFREAIRAGADPKTLEWAAVVEEGGQRYFHYMKAIPTGQICLTCHGKDIDPEVRRAILARYPADAATGFEAGELRGAFTFVKPLD